jgi:phospholipase/carboxylesterase
VNSNFLLVGFSQGGALALYTTLRFQYQVKALVILSSYLPLCSIPYFQAYQHLQKQAHQIPDKHASSLSLFWGHGQYDSLIALHWGLKSFQLLKPLLATTSTLKSYPMDHAACLAEQQDILAFLSSLQVATASN